MMNAKKGISSYQLARDLEIKQKAAWYMTIRIRREMAEKENRLLSGIVEIDETYIGGKPRRHGQPKAKRGRGTKKIPVIGAVERNGGKVVAQVMPNVSGWEIEQFVKGYVKEGESKVMTDEYKGYDWLDNWYPHEVDNHHAHSSDNRTHGREDPSLEVVEHHGHHEFNGERITSGIAVGLTYNQKLELEEWLQTGKLTPYVEQELKRREEFRRNHMAGRLLQRVVTPDGQLGQVVVYEYNMYNEGDAILQSELVTPESHSNLFPAKPWRGRALILPEIVDPEGVRHYVPDEYYEITDKYEREEYFNKFEKSITLGISMDEVETKIAAGELDVSLSDTSKQHVDERLARYAAIEERTRLIDMGWPKPTPLDKSPVKVRFKPELEAVDGLSGLKHRSLRWLLMTPR